jgi:Domain of unknown function (DUF6378)
MATMNEGLKPDTAYHELTNKPGEAEALEANGLVNGDRQADYGSPAQNYAGIAKVWSGILWPKLKRDITPAEAALMMAGLKLQRQAMRPKRDNVVDAHGYLLVHSHVLAEIGWDPEAPREKP